MNRLGALGELGHDGVPRLVERDDAPLFGVGQAVLALEPDHHAIDRRVQLGHAHFDLLVPRSEERRLVEHVLEVGSHHARCAAGDILEVDVIGQLHLARVNLENGVAAGAVGTIDEYLPIEASRTQQRIVQDLGAVGGGQSR